MARIVCFGEVLLRLASPRGTLLLQDKRLVASFCGAVDTPMLWNSPTLKSGAEKLDPADVGQPEDIAQTICFLASEAAAFITGAEVLADGGRLAHL